MAGQVLKVLLTSRIFDCTFLLEDLEEVSTAGIIPSQVELKELLDHGKPESEEAELELMEQHQVDYEKIFEPLKKLTNTFSEEKIRPHHTTALVLLDLCRGERKWKFLTEEERKKLTKNKLIQNLREPKQCIQSLSPASFSVGSLSVGGFSATGCHRPFRQLLASSNSSTSL